MIKFKLMKRTFILFLALSNCVSQSNPAKEVSLSLIGPDARRTCAAPVVNNRDPLVNCIIAYPNRSFIVKCSCSSIEEFNKKD